jgi:D-aminopeptidase
MEERPARARDLGILVGNGVTGAHNAITDVAGVRVGHTTLVTEPGVRSGVTAIVPDALLDFGARLRAAVVVGNGYGKFVGSTQIRELGVIETPILLTATLSTFRVADALVGWMLALPGHEEVQSLNPVVGETNDGFLSDIRARPVTGQHVVAALQAAASGPVDEGCVGAGTGVGALGFKAGMGTSSRIVTIGDDQVVVAAIVQANFSGTLTVGGIRMPKATLLAGIDPAVASGPDSRVGNSCVVVLATDAPLDARQLGRVGRRALIGLAHVGSDFAGGSGDYAIAFSTADAARRPLDDADLDPLFRAAMDSVAEAILNSLFTAHTTMGHEGHVKYAVPHAIVLDLLGRRSGRE